MVNFKLDQNNVKEIELSKDEWNKIETKFSPYYTGKDNIQIGIDTDERLYINNEKQPEKGHPIGNRATVAQKIERNNKIIIYGIYISAGFFVPENYLHKSIVNMVKEILKK